MKKHRDELRVEFERGRVMKKWRKIDWSVLIVFSLILIIGLLAAPMLLRLPNIQCLVSCFSSGLKRVEYKEAYIGVWGGIIGSFLGVVGAVWVQKSSEKHQNRIQIEKCITIVYYDVKLFFQELQPFVIQLKGANDETEYAKIYRNNRANVGIHFSEDWIRDVAELSGVIEEKYIDQLYLFYGIMIDIKALLNKSEYASGDEVLFEKKMGEIGTVENGKSLTFRAIDTETLKISTVLGMLEQKRNKQNAHKW